ncbi:MAG: hypothetical protein K2X55_15430 [Burkholderiaceae bacterium]|nr:hypothetical protein [Burkholderiaceae bacterium]
MHDGSEELPSLDGLRTQLEKRIALADVTEALEFLAAYIDASGDVEDEHALVEALRLADTIDVSSFPESASLLCYYRANAWADLHRIRHFESASWSWEHPELLKQVYWLRASVQHEGFEALSSLTKAQVHCNLGNALSTGGRFVDALVEWRNALRYIPHHGMARGNLGIGLGTYSEVLYDGGHQERFLMQAGSELAKAVDGGIGRDGATFPEALAQFEWRLKRLEAHFDGIDLRKEAPKKKYSLGRTREEQRFREWALERRLFLNPMNDLSTGSISAHDVLMLPNHKVGDAGISYLAFFNQLKQEYVFARWNLFEGITKWREHVADRLVRLSFNSDYALYSISIEQVKTAYRFAYSLFDKIAYFINSYWKLGIPEKQISFRTVWVEQVKGRTPPLRVRETFETSKNLPLRGLFWLSKDLFDAELRDVAQPNAKALDAFRNHLEHKCVKVVDS